MLCIPNVLYLSPIILLGNLTKNPGVHSPDNNENVNIFLSNSQTVKLKNNNHTSELSLWSGGSRLPIEINQIYIIFNLEYIVNQMPFCPAPENLNFLPV